MKILGSGKVDDFKKVAISDRVLANMNVKPGDSVIFYKKLGDNGVSMFRAEGSMLTSECDSPQRLHLREAPIRLRKNMFLAMLFIILAFVAVAMNFGSLPLMGFVFSALFIVLALVGMILSALVTKSMDDPSDGQSFVTVGGIYNKNRLCGISKLSTDGYVVSGDLFVNSLFSANPSKVEVNFVFNNGTEVLGLVKCIKSVPGYNVYKVRMKAKSIGEGKMFVKVTYLYEGKTIELTATYNVADDDGSQDIKLSEGPVESVLKFDETLNSRAFDETLFDPEEEEA